MEEMIRVENFGKNYGPVRAVDGLSLAVEENEILGLIGPDGAGKTTTMRTLCTLLPLEEGAMSIAGYDVRHHITEIRSLLGYMPQRFSLYPDLSVEQNLLFFADLFAVPATARKERLDRLYEFSQLGPFRRRLAGQLSGGMKQKLALSCTLIHTPQVLVLDEPTTGVDPVSRRDFWEILHAMRREGVTILVSTPYMDEANQCDRVAFMHKGRLLAVDRPAAMVRRFSFALYEVVTAEPRALLDYFRDRVPSRSARLFGDRLHVAFDRPLDESQRQRILDQAPQPVTELRQIEPGMEDVFLELMKSG